MTRGLFLVFEGIDGSGKSTQVERLVHTLRAAGHDVVQTREPHDCPAGRRIREMARSGKRVAPEEELAWFVEQRHDHVREVVTPALEAGRTVVCDRYFLSSVAYQGARGLDAAAILEASEAAFPIPDLVLLVVLEPALGMARVGSRGEPAEPAFEDLAFQERVAEQFTHIDRPYVERVDGRGDAETVASRVATALRGRLGLVVYPSSSPTTSERRERSDP